VCILLGFRRPGGALIVCGGAALLASIIFWIVLGGPMSIESPPIAIGTVLVIVLNVSAITLLIAAWTLAIHAAATSRRWLWVSLLVVAGYISFLATYFAYFSPQACYGGAMPMPSVLLRLLCGEPSPLLPLVFDLAHLLGPALVLIYGLVIVRSGRDVTRPAVASSGGRRGPPPGLYISPINSALLEEDTEPNVH
jgi:hypothetical protein